jgi:hypothetical protein
VTAESITVFPQAAACARHEEEQELPENLANWTDLLVGVVAVLFAFSALAGVLF